VRDHRAGRLREAVSAYEALLRRAPNDAEVLQLLGLALGQLGRDADAAVLLARSVELKPDRPAVLLNLAQALHATGDENAALRACERALTLDRSAAKEIPRSAAARPRDDRSLAGGYRLHAAILSALGRRQEALASAGQAVRLAMQDAAAHADLGVALKAVGRELDALECFERAIALDPNLAAAHHNRALLLARRGEHEGALQSFDRAGRAAAAPCSSAQQSRQHPQGARTCAGGCAELLAGAREQRIDQRRVPHQLPAVFGFALEPLQLLARKGQAVIETKRLEVRHVAVQHLPERVPVQEADVIPSLKVSTRSFQFMVSGITRLS